MARVSKQDRLRLSDPWLTTGHRFDHTHYHSSNQALVYIGPYLLDEVVSIQYTFRQSKVPIYSYASMYYDALATGRCMGQGQLSLNYIDQGYLFMAMLQAHKLQRPGSAASQEYYQALSIFSQNNQHAKEIARRLGKFHQNYFQDLEQGRTLNTRDMRHLSDTIARHPGVRNQLMETLRTRFWGKTTQLKRERQGLDRNINNSHLDKFFSQEQFQEEITNARPDQLPPINIVVSHGNPLDKRYNTYKVLREVEFIEQNMAMIPTGQAQVENHSFVFKTMG